MKLTQEQHDLLIKTTIFEMGKHFALKAYCLKIDWSITRIDIYNTIIEVCNLMSIDASEIGIENLVDEVDNFFDKYSEF